MLFQSLVPILPPFIRVSIRKRPAEADSTEPPPLDQPETAKTARSYGRIYGRQDDPFTSIDTVVNFGIKYEIADEGDESNDERPTLSIRYFCFLFVSRLSQN